MKREPMVGDVFIVPTGDGRAGTGQVVAAYGASNLYFAIFSEVMSVEMAERHAVEATASPLALLGLSMDGKLFTGGWPTVGHAPVAADMPLPAYKELVEVPDKYDVVDFSGSRRRRATPAEVALLLYRRVFSPMAIELAWKASLGLGPSLEVFDSLHPEGHVTSADMFD